MILKLHVAAGLVALLAGGLALVATKGGRVHRAGGTVFAAAIVAMTVTAIVVATWQRPNVGNSIAALLTFYVTLTGAVEPSRWVRSLRPWLIALVTVGAALGVAAAALGTLATARPNGAIEGIPAAAFYLFACVALAAAAGDVRLLVLEELGTAARRMRHIWRMGFALWISVTSFFIGQARHLPVEMRGAGGVPVALVAIVCAYWFARAWRRGRHARRVAQCASAAYSRTPGGSGA